ncbi:MAG: hypothetical protein GTO17_05035 [Candidatus Aminicenantes bacterium]|nr:hypothetical protein [Candidatus Aminicenantes bacterium]
MKKTLLILLSIFLCWSVHTGQQMSEPVMVSDTPPDSSKWAQVAFGPDGKAHVIWVEDWHDAAGADIHYASYDGKAWEGPVDLTNSRNKDAARPYICTSKQGGIFVAYDQEDSCYLVEYDPDQEKWLSPFRVSPAGYGGHEPAVAADPDGNVYVMWFAKVGSRAYTRSRIDGIWEDVKKMSGNRRSTQVGIAAGNDGRVWGIWREKQSNGEYKIYYRRRKKGTDWTAPTKINWGGASQTHPHITVGPDNVPVVTYADWDTGYPPEIFLCTIDEDENPREKIFPGALQHYSRIAIDPDGNKHVAWQFGPGERGRGIRYLNNIGGEWNDPVTLPNSQGGPKLPGISSDEGGNVAVVWSASISGRDKEVWFSSLYPIVPLNPPINMAINITVKNLKGTPEIDYDLSWEPNPENDESRTKGYNIYKRENEGEWELLLSVNKSTHTASFSFTGAETRVQFGIATVSTYDTQGQIAIFGID